MERKFYTVKEASALLRVHRTTLIQYIKEGLVEATKLKHRYLIPCEAIDRMVEVGAR